ncbi:hypothetical protein PPACK8108_LOCUS7194 [Phakopsora pachyrhizi]|uniref:Uncharacterized protein n=1 Tax=Phakopsora pachyrhizi TaxID=170000 RepID=A0AAV0AST8_PHAPC|nr:hypothetical protein PPACK8108_LOCUS7194 [Phakopsora pachyrhizi]
MIVPNYNSSTDAFRRTAIEPEGEGYLNQGPNDLSDIASIASLQYVHNNRVQFESPGGSSLNGCRTNDINYHETTVESRLECPQIINAQGCNVSTLKAPDNIYKNPLNRYDRQDNCSQYSEERMLYGMRRHSSFRYDDSPESNKYPEDVCTNDVFKDESGHPISNNFTHRIHSQIAISEVGALQSFLLQQDPRDFQMMENMNEIPSFYVPRSGDPEKISFNRKNLPRESKVDSSTNFSYPIPPTQPRPETPPEVPGPIMSRGRPRSVTAFGLSNNRYAPSKNKKRGPILKFTAF